MLQKPVLRRAPVEPRKPTTLSKLSWLHLCICLNLIPTVFKDSFKMAKEITTLNSTAA